MVDTEESDKHYAYQSIKINTKKERRNRVFSFGGTTTGKYSPWGDLSFSKLFMIQYSVAFKCYPFNMMHCYCCYNYLCFYCTCKSLWLSIWLSIREREKKEKSIIRLPGYKQSVPNLSSSVKSWPPSQNDSMEASTTQQKVALHLQEGVWFKLISTADQQKREQLLMRLGHWKYESVNGIASNKITWEIKHFSLT